MTRRHQLSSDRSRTRPTNASVVVVDVAVVVVVAAAAVVVVVVVVVVDAEILHCHLPIIRHHRDQANVGGESRVADNQARRWIES